MISFKIVDNKRIGIIKDYDTVKIFHLNVKGEFIGVHAVKEKEFAEYIEKLVPEDMKIWR